MLIAVKKNVINDSKIEIREKINEYNNSRDSGSVVEHLSAKSKSRNGSVTSLDNAMNNHSLKTLGGLHKAGSSLVRLLPKMHSRVPSTIKLSEQPSQLTLPKIKDASYYYGTNSMVNKTSPTVVDANRKFNSLGSKVSATDEVVQKFMKGLSD